VDDDDNQVGVIPLEDAKRRAREAGLDLVEVSPNSTPPVCRVMDYGKWKYQQKKKEQKQKSHTKQSELKEVRLRPKIDDHDLDIKMAKARQFLGEGHKVQFTMQFRGREMAHRDIGVRILRELAATLEEISKIETHPRSQGRRMTMVLAPDRKGAKEKEKGKAKKDGAAAKPAPAKQEAAKQEAAKQEAPQPQSAEASAAS
jgi:translation initiation factor IF-3